MPKTEAQKRAIRNYMKHRVKSKMVHFYPKDKELYDYMHEQPNMNAYILDLIRADMEKNKNKA